MNKCVRVSTRGRSQRIQKLVERSNYPPEACRLNDCRLSQYPSSQASATAVFEASRRELAGRLVD